MSSVPRGFLNNRLIQHVSLSPSRSLTSSELHRLKSIKLYCCNMFMTGLADGDASSISPAYSTGHLQHSQFGWHRIVNDARQQAQLEWQRAQATADIAAHGKGITMYANKQITKSLQLNWKCMGTLLKMLHQNFLRILRTNKYSLKILKSYSRELNTKGLRYLQVMCPVRIPIRPQCVTVLLCYVQHSYCTPVFEFPRPPVPQMQQLRRY